MRMAAGSSFADMEVPADATLFGALSDLSNFCYWLGLPDQLCRFFCLAKPVALQRLVDWGVPDSICRGCDSAARASGAAPVWVHPRLLVCPSGWNWAFWLGQRAHSHMVLVGSGLPASRLAED